MRDTSKRNILGVLIDATDYQKTMDFVFDAAREKRRATVSDRNGLAANSADRAPWGSRWWHWRRA